MTDHASHSPAAEALDYNPIGESLTGRHAHLAVSRGRILAYDPRVAAFGSLPADAAAADWADAATLLGPGGELMVAGAAPRPPAEAGWGEASLQVVRMEPTARLAADDPTTVTLGTADMEEMRALVARADPTGHAVVPLRPRALDLGTYLGIREGDRLVAMAAERFTAPGETEIAAVCTDPGARGRGLAARVVGAVAAMIEGRGERIYIQVYAGNTAAIEYFARAGFAETLRFTVRELTAPGLA